MEAIPKQHGSLFTGLGGFDLAGEMAGWITAFQVEKNEFCNGVLRRRFPNVTKYGTIEDFAENEAHKYRGTIDVISGGFPCQGFSLAGQRLGTFDGRYLWPEMRKVYQAIRPGWVVAENVSCSAQKKFMTANGITSNGI